MRGRLQRQEEGQRSPQCSALYHRRGLAEHRPMVLSNLTERQVLSNLPSVPCLESTKVSDAEEWEFRGDDWHWGDLGVMQRIRYSESGMRCVYTV